MKLMLSSAIVVFASSLLLPRAVVADTCQVCAGSDYRDVVIPISDSEGTTVTCQDVVLSAAAYDEDDEVCLSLKYSEALCCPDVASTCTICQGPVLYDYLEIPDTDGVTCGMFALLMAEFDIASQNCTDFQVMEEVCCPDEYDPAPSTSPPGIFSSPPPTFLSRYVLSLCYYH